MLGVSIIIPCFNNGHYLLEAVDSVVKQPFACDCEIIVVDDGSTDEQTLKALEYIANKVDKLLYLDINHGVQYARNHGIQHSRFDYILPLDADDCLNTDLQLIRKGTYPDKAIAVLENNDDIAFVHCISTMFGDYQGYTISAYPVNYSQILRKHHAPTSIIYRKCDAIAAGLYKEDIIKWQDWSFAVALLNARFKNGKCMGIIFLEDPFHCYRIHDDLTRISTQIVCEREMISLTINQNIELFNSEFPELNISEVADKIFKSKPDKLTDLLHIAANNLNTALQMARQRDYQLASSIEPDGIP